MRSYPGKQQGRAQLRCPGAEGRERTDGWMEGLSRKGKVQMPGQIQGWRRTRPGSSPAQPQAAEERKAAFVDNRDQSCSYKVLCWSVGLECCGEDQTQAKHCRWLGLSLWN
ncbi:hypothetical protein SRHO_G00119320 [Serrasalmus rhombeus]